MSAPTPLYSVTQLNRQIRQWLEDQVGVVAVEGELSNVSLPASGHVYFTLKDATAQLRCVYFKNRHRAAHGLQNGQKKILQGQLSLYEGRGDYQLIVESIQDAGLGDLFQQFEALKLKLSKAGWFDAARKKQLPSYPQCIGVITSLSAAALRDVLTTLARRFPLAHVLLYPSDVQGQEAPQQLMQALAHANRDARADVLLLVRGGGSFEDLWAFNHEALAYAIANSVLPIVSGIGHETDFTLADFVADHRAATPTAAAEAVTPDQADLMAYLTTLATRLSLASARLWREKEALLQQQFHRLTDPRRLILMHWQTLDDLERRLYHIMQQQKISSQQTVALLLLRLQAMHPQRLLQEAKVRLIQVDRELKQWIDMRWGQSQQRLEKNMGLLHAISPLATLDRGYALAMQGNTVLTDASQVDKQKPLEIRLAKGQLRCMCVKSI